MLIKFCWNKKNIWFNRLINQYLIFILNIKKINIFLFQFIKTIYNMKVLFEERLIFIVFITIKYFVIIVINCFIKTCISDSSLFWISSCICLNF